MIHILWCVFDSHFPGLIGLYHILMILGWSEILLNLKIASLFSLVKLNLIRWPIIILIFLLEFLFFRINFPRNGRSLELENVSLLIRGIWRGTMKNLIVFQEHDLYIMGHSICLWWVDNFFRIVRTRFERILFLNFPA